MAKRDLNRSARRFLSALRRTGAGLEKQRERIMARADDAPRLLPGEPYEVINLTGDEGNDLDYYIYELARLQDLGQVDHQGLQPAAGARRCPGCVRRMHSEPAGDPQPAHAS